MRVGALGGDGYKQRGGRWPNRWHGTGAGRTCRTVWGVGHLITALVTPGPDGISPVEADPDARRCGISDATLRAMR